MTQELALLENKSLTIAESGIEEYKPEPEVHKKRIVSFDTETTGLNSFFGARPFLFIMSEMVDVEQVIINPNPDVTDLECSDGRQTHHPTLY